MKKYIATALLPVLLGLSACGAPAPGSPTDSVGGTVTEYYEYGDDQSVKVIEIQGNTCYLYDGYESGGIWCLADGSPVGDTDGFE